MENNDILVRFHEQRYREQVNATLHQDHFRNAEIVPVSQQIHLALDKALGAAQGALCRYEFLGRTAICQDVDV
jgi:hypothetical protein